MWLPSLANHNCHVYQGLISKLEQSLNAAINNKQKKTLLLNFSKNYLMPNELWQMLKNLDELSFFEIQLKPVNNPEYHYFFEWTTKTKFLESQNISPIHQGPSLAYLFSKLITKDEFYFEDLKYPNSKLNESFMKFEEISSSFPSGKLVKEFEKMKDLFVEIKSNENESEKWFQSLQKVRDHEFLKNNVEFRLGENLGDQNLWKLYINYLKVFEPQLMLHTYSKYCRLFLSDFEMKKEYMKATNENDLVVGLEWNNLFEFEKPFNKKIVNESAQKIKKLQQYGLVSAYRKEKIMPDLDLSNVLSNNLKSQDFGFPKPIIRYIFTKADDSLLTKFHQSCKYFYIQKPKLFCYRLVIDSDSSNTKTEFIENSLATGNLLPFKLHVSISISLKSKFSSFTPHASFVSQIIQQNILRCTAKYIHFSGVQISEKDFDFLVEHENVEVVFLEQSAVSKTTNLDGRYLAVEQILEKLPKLKSFTSDFNYYTPKSAEILATFNFKNKFLKFDISSVPSNFNSENYGEFLKKNAAPYSKFSLTFSRNVDENVISQFEQIIHNFISNWNHPYGEPEVTVTVGPL